jgi:hypothetical protein
LPRRAIAEALVLAHTAAGYCSSCRNMLPALLYVDVDVIRTEKFWVKRRELRTYV